MEKGLVLNDLDSGLLGSLESTVNEQQGNWFGVEEMEREKERGVSLREIKGEIISPKLNKGKNLVNFAHSSLN